jgi:hypothetical protein
MCTHQLFGSFSSVRNQVRILLADELQGGVGTHAQARRKIITTCSLKTLDNLNKQAHFQGDLHLNTQSHPPDQVFN